MAIKSFAYEDKDAGWKLEKTTFDDVNLLVGVSGVGKSWILSALAQMRNAAVGLDTPTGGLSWDVEFACGQTNYRWVAATGSVAANRSARGKAPQASFVQDVLTKANGEVIYKRENGSLYFEDTKLPKLSDSESGIFLLREEEAVGPAFASFSRVLYSVASGEKQTFGGYFQKNDKDAMFACESMDQLREWRPLPLFDRAYILQEQFPAVFELLKQQYSALFPLVDDLRFGFRDELNGASPGQGEQDKYITYAIEERGVAVPIVGGQHLSEGMYRALIHLLEIALAPTESVILIDEVENSLGANCLPGLFDRFLEVSDNIQFIVTSHHPYVINSVPKHQWKLVTRHGSTVSVRSGSEIKSLQTASQLDAFTLLINAPEYEEGIA